MLPSLAWSERSSGRQPSFFYSYRFSVGLGVLRRQRGYITMGQFDSGEFPDTRRLDGVQTAHFSRLIFYR